MLTKILQPDPDAYTTPIFIGPLCRVPIRSQKRYTFTLRHVPTLLTCNVCTSNLYPSHTRRWIANPPAKHQIIPVKTQTTNALDRPVDAAGATYHLRPIRLRPRFLCPPKSIRHNPCYYSGRLLARPHASRRFAMGFSFHGFNDNQSRVINATVEAHKSARFPHELSTNLLGR